MNIRSARPASGHTLFDFLLLTVSSVAMWMTFPGRSWWFLAVPSLALLIGIIDRVAPFRAMVYCIFWGMAFFLPLISWIQIATENTVLAWVTLAVGEAFFVGLWGLSFSAMGVWSWARTILGQAFGAAVLWVAFEELRSKVPFGGFPWGKIAHPQVDSSLVVYAPLGGETLVAFVIVFIAVLVRRIFAIAPSPTNSSFLSRFFAACLAGLIVVAPTFAKLSNVQEAGAVKVGVVQGNIEVPMSETFAKPGKVTGNHVRQTLEMANLGHKPDIVFWGENSTDIDPRTDTKIASVVDEAVKAIGVPAVIGVMEYHGNYRYNLLGVWEPGEGLTEEIYGKQHPVPWGEYLPFRDLTLRIAPAAKRINVDLVGMDNPGLLTVDLKDGRELPVAVGICFEVAYEPIIAEGIQLGGQMIAIPTNNAHFRDSDESVQQLQMGRFRAAQFSRSALQISTNGVSAIIRPDGTVYDMTEVQTAAHMVASVPLRTAMTPSALMGTAPSNVFITLGLTMSTFSVGAYIYSRSIRKRHAKKQYR